jgi:hypothetical protein
MTKFLALVALGLFIASSASAVPPIKIEKNPDGSGWASATALAAKETGGSVNCFTLDGLVACVVVDADGERALCVSQDPEHIAAVRGVPSCFGIYMHFDALAKCTRLVTQMGSTYKEE